MLSRENDEDWYEACNPGVEGARGLVPVSYFETIGKTERQSVESGASAISTVQGQDGYRRSSTTLIENENQGTAHTRATASAPVPQRGQGGRGKMIYGSVLYDFKAERPDELDANAGESIIIIAQSTSEWFVAKPIGRLGGPGLIPITFIEIRDMTSGQAVQDPGQAIRAAGVPGVAEWKRMAAEYKAGSISLGKFEAPNALPSQPGQSSNSLPQGMERLSLRNGQQNTNGHVSLASRLRNCIDADADQAHPNHDYNHQQHGWQGQDNYRVPVSASVPRYCFENDKYRYIIECVMDDGTHWELSRYYQDFYDLQISMLQRFPEGKPPQNPNEPPPDRPQQRVLPFMPGPVTYVTDDISNKRRMCLDDYVRVLLTLDPEMSRCDLVKQLFAPREGDFELDPTALQEDYRLSQASQQSYPAASSSSISRQTSHSQIHNSYAQQQQRYMGQQFPQYSQASMSQQHPANRNQHPGYPNANNNGYYAEPMGSYKADPSGYYDEAYEEPDPRTTKLKFWFMDDLKKARVDSFNLFDVKRAIRTNIGSLNPEGREIEILANDAEEVITSDEQLRLAFRMTRNKPVFWVRLL